MWGQSFLDSSPKNNLILEDEKQTFFNFGSSNAIVTIILVEIHPFCVVVKSISSKF